ncbi:methyltransferase domain-containing protein [Mesorhizobium sp. MSK_1335]|uniref:Methyltransferase domain-containing protein n=1 Tax=Mesorhizobium montanum TaxID=3072323 RepID=A0ABU4ZJI8_9HYPH|nr:methyltransferase domain-containing protein [Mesorhizobium sp. MSK_1335]MDX8524186.1 methyltransferase domain-containing protein [Mesorhizobium sp. MSK_1335]
MGTTMGEVLRAESCIVADTKWTTVRMIPELSFVSPSTKQPLTKAPDGSALLGGPGERYPLIEGMPQLLVHSGQAQASGESQAYYRDRASEYDRGIEALFAMLLANEEQTRREMFAELDLRQDSRVLEIGCGTCRDTIHLLDMPIDIFAGDLSLEMLLTGQDRLRRAAKDTSRLQLFCADVMHLPFADEFFDAVYHFGGLNLFPDHKKALEEITRVVKPNGRVVVGDEGIAPWLANSQFANILENSNPLFRHRAPLDCLPVAARQVTCRWILSGSFYLISFVKGEGEPPLDLDVEFPGRRGGSHRTRYFGKLEGVSPELRGRVLDAAAAEGLSVTAWLERTLGRATRNVARDGVDD